MTYETLRAANQADFALYCAVVAVVLVSTAAVTLYASLATMGRAASQLARSTALPAFWRLGLG